MTINDLKTISGVGPVTAKRLAEAGVESINAVAAATLEALVEITKFPIARVTAIRQAAATLQESIAEAVAAPEDPTPVADEKGSQEPDSQGRNGDKKKDGKKKSKDSDKKTKTNGGRMMSKKKDEKKKDEKKKSKKKDDKMMSKKKDEKKKSKKKDDKKKKDGGKVKSKKKSKK